MYLGIAPEVGEPQFSTGRLLDEPPNLLYLRPSTHTSNEVMPAMIGVLEGYDSSGEHSRHEVVAVPSVDPQDLEEAYVIHEIVRPLGELVMGRSVDVPALRAAMDALPANEAAIIGALETVPEGMLSLVVDRFHRFQAKAVGERTQRRQEERSRWLLLLLSKLSWMEEPDFGELLSDEGMGPVLRAYDVSDAARRGRPPRLGYI